MLHKQKESLLNVVLKRNSQQANPMILKMLRLVPIKALYCLCLVAIKALYPWSILFLQTNGDALLSQLSINPSTEVVKIYKTKIESPLGNNWSPKEGCPKQD
jgi:hypothetical protein